jgi:hypothetical protein
MVEKAKEWESYEQVAVYLLDRIAEEFGLERVEGKQGVYGGGTTTTWEIDGKGVKIGDEGFVVIECRRYMKSKQNQGQLGKLAFTIRDTGATGGILVSPLGFQEGAKKVAAAEGIQEVLMSPTSTRTDYMLKFLNKVFVGMSGAARSTGHASFAVIRVDGSRETFSSDDS